MGPLTLQLSQVKPGKFFVDVPNKNHLIPSILKVRVLYKWVYSPLPPLMIVFSLFTFYNSILLLSIKDKNSFKSIFLPKEGYRDSPGVFTVFLGTSSPYRPHHVTYIGKFFRHLSIRHKIFDKKVLELDLKSVSLLRVCVYVKFSLLDLFCLW